MITCGLSGQPNRINQPTQINANQIEYERAGLIGSVIAPVIALRGGCPDLVSVWVRAHASVTPLRHAQPIQGGRNAVRGP